MLRPGHIVIATLALGLVVATAPAYAISPVPKTEQFQAGIYFLSGLPQQEFADNVDKNAYGLAIDGFYSPPRSPLAIGLEFGFANYGREVRRERFSTTIPDVTVRVETSNNMVHGNLILRMQSTGRDIRPYADGLIGFNYIYTETKISDADDPSEDVASSTNLDDAVFVYGGGGGVMVRVYSSKSGKPWSMYLNGGARYMAGGEAQYLKKGSIRRSGGVVTYDITRSKTDLLAVHVGLTFAF